MAHPKRRHSNRRTNTRRAHDALKLKSLTSCKQCGAKVLPHRICPKCGYYRGRQVVSIRAPKEKKK